MATASEKNEISELKTAFAVQARDIKYLVTSIDDLKAQMKAMSFVPLVIYEKDMNALRDEIKDHKTRIQELEDYNDQNKVGTVFAGLLGNKAMTFVVGLMIAAALYVAIKGDIQP